MEGYEGDLVEGRVPVSANFDPGTGFVRWMTHYLRLISDAAPSAENL